MDLLLFFAFLSGLVTILAPCIWPLLPIILSSSTTGGKSKSLGITIGIVTSFAIFTLTISSLVMFFHFDPDILRLVAVIIIGFLGLTMIVPVLSQQLEGFVSSLSSSFGSHISTQKNSFGGGFVTGASLGIVWSPCAGPILATIATLGATQAVNFQAVLVTISYSLGVAVPLFFFSYAGSWFFTKSRFVSKYTGRIQQVFGVLMILTAVAIYTNYDKVVQVKLLDLFPSYASLLTNFENNTVVKRQLDTLKGKQANLQTMGNAPEFVGIFQWLNTEPLTMQSLRGKVVLIDFWTYTCINCIRTLPYVTSWYEKYKDSGFVVVGVHTPEFEFEKKTKNVEDAIKRHSITYPVAQDNDYKTWDAYNNHYWPAKYLIDANGKIRYSHFGEGKYEETEKAIQELLKEAGKSIKEDMANLPDQTPRLRLTPETYLGSQRASVFNDYLSLDNTWTITQEYAVSSFGSVLTLTFYADKVFLVMRPGKNTAGKVRVLLDGKVVDADSAGDDVQNGIVTITEDRLYRLIDLKGNPSEHILRLEFQTEGIEAYAFTFG